MFERALKIINLYRLSKERERRSGRLFFASLRNTAKTNEHAWRSESKDGGDPRKLRRLSRRVLLLRGEQE